MAARNEVVAMGSVDVVLFRDGAVSMAIPDLTGIREVGTPPFDIYLPSSRVREACEEAARDLVGEQRDGRIAASDAYAVLSRVYRLAGGEGGMLDSKGRPGARPGEGDEKR